MSNWISCKDKTPDLIENETYSENVFTWCNNQLMVMSYGFNHSEDLECNGYYWANCYGDINGDAEWDDNYYPTHWQPLLTEPNTHTQPEKDVWDNSMDN